MDILKMIEMPLIIVVLYVIGLFVYMIGFIINNIITNILNIRLSNKIKVLEGKLKAANILISNLINKK